jgi:uncharacterized membrane protein
MSVSNFVALADARVRFGIASAIAAITLFFLRGHVRLSAELIATWDAFAFCAFVLTWITILTTPAHQLRGRAQKQDFGRFLIFVSVVIAACAALFAVAFLIRVDKGQMRDHFTIHLILALATVIFSWSLMHTVFGMHYAHAFYGDSDEVKDRHAGGLVFPGDRLPDCFDFAYFSFVIGMTCQVSDVQITSRRMRRLTLLHSVLAFGFNTLILALLINTVSSLL